MIGKIIDKIYILINYALDYLVLHYNYLIYINYIECIHIYLSGMDSKITYINNRLSLRYGLQVKLNTSILGYHNKSYIISFINIILYNIYIYIYIYIYIIYHYF